MGAEGRGSPLSVLGPFPWPSNLGPHLVGPRAPKYCNNKFMNKLFIQDYPYSKLKHYTYSRHSKSYLERPSYGLQNKQKGF